MPPPTGATSASTDIAVIDRHTGQVLEDLVLDLANAEDVQLARLRADLIDLGHRLDAYTSELDAELVARMDRNNLLTLDVGPYKLTIPGAEAKVWDEPQLGLELEALVQDGRLSRAAAKKALPEKLTRRAAARELEKLLKHVDPEVRRAIAACYREQPRTSRRVTITTTRGAR